MKSKIRTIALIAITSSIFISCVGNDYVGDKMTEGWVVNEWQSGAKKVIQVKLNGDYLTIDDTYFGDTNPKVGDCVKIWVSVSKRSEQIPRGNRNISNCSPTNR